MHGDNIRISREGTVAKRYESFCKGITFSARPVRVNERVCVKFLDISNNWSGVIRFGFTCNDPASLRGNLPKYACPDLTNKPGFWAKALNERYCYRGNVLFYYVTPSGDVHFGINGEEKGVFITDVDARGPLWAVIDVYGNSTAIEFLDSRIYMFQAQQQQHQQQPVPVVTTFCLFPGTWCIFQWGESAVAPARSHFTQSFDRDSAKPFGFNPSRSRSSN